MFSRRDELLAVVVVGDDEVVAFEAVSVLELALPLPVLLVLLLVYVVSMSSIFSGEARLILMAADEAASEAEPFSLRPSSFFLNCCFNSEDLSVNGLISDGLYFSRSGVA